MLFSVNPEMMAVSRGMFGGEAVAVRLFRLLFGIIKEDYSMIWLTNERHWNLTGSEEEKPPAGTRVIDQDSPDPPDPSILRLRNQNMYTSSLNSFSLIPSTHPVTAHLAFFSI